MEVEEISNAILKHLALLEERANRSQQTSMDRAQYACTNMP